MGSSGYARSRARAVESAELTWISTLGRGMFKMPEEFNDPDRDGRKMNKQDDKYIRVTKKLDELAKRKKTIITSIALAYVMHKAPYVFPIVGGRKVEHLKGNIEALAVKLTQEEVDEIEDAEPFDVGFPLSFLFQYGGGKPYRTRYTAEDLGLVRANTNLESVKKLSVSGFPRREVI